MNRDWDAAGLGSPPRAAPGTRLNGIYEIERLIATGGMGEVYKGRAIETGDAVAIKMIRADFAENRAAIALFRKEASALHNLSHEAIVRYYVFSIDPILRCPYLAMEFVEGRSLSEVLRGGPLDFESVRVLQRRLAAGLEAAHELGIVHRDVAPDNVILPGGKAARAKIIDFGIARSPVGEGTIIGSGFAGKHNYVSPEQLGLFGGEVTAKSDIYSLGLVLAEALSGRPLDMGGSQLQVIDKRRKVPDLSGVDSRMRPLLQRMLQPNPNDRPKTMAAVAAWPVGAGPPAVAVLRPRRAGPWIAASALAGVAALGAAAFLAFPQWRPGIWDGGKSAAPPLETAPPLESAAPGAGPAEVSPSLTPPGLPGPGADALQRPEGRDPAAEAPPAPVPAPLPAPARRAGIDEVTRYINDYDGGDCFFVAPLAVGEGRARIEAYGASPAPFQLFDDDFKLKNGFEAQIDLRKITPAQCPVAAFVSRLRDQRAAAPRMDIDVFALRSGQVLNGKIDNFGARHVDVLLVDDNGVVQNLSSLAGAVTRTAGAVTFKLRIEGSGGKAAKPQVLLAIASAKPLNALASRAPAEAQRLWPQVLNEVGQNRQGIGVALKYFKLEG